MSPKQPISMTIQQALLARVDAMAAGEERSRSHMLAILVLAGLRSREGRGLVHWLNAMGIPCMPSDFDYDSIPMNDYTTCTGLTGPDRATCPTCVIALQAWRREQGLDGPAEWEPGVLS